MTVAIIIFFIGAFIALGVLAVAIFILRQIVKSKKSERNHFVGSGHYSGIGTTDDSDDSNDFEAYQPLYFSSNDEISSGKVETGADVALGISQTADSSNEFPANYSEASEGTASVADSSYTESSYSDSSSDSSSSYSDSSSDSSSGSSSSWD